MYASLILAIAVSNISQYVEAELLTIYNTVVYIRAPYPV